MSKKAGSESTQVKIIKPAPTTKDQANSTHRLSRIRPMAVPNIQGSWAEDYFKKNPEEKEVASPVERLATVDDLLAGDCTKSKRFELMARRQGLVDIVHGCESPESGACHHSIGVLYSRNVQMNSADRHLERAVELCLDKKAPRVELCYVKVMLKRLAAARTLLGLAGDLDEDEIPRDCLARGYYARGALAMDDPMSIISAIKDLRAAIGLLEGDCPEAAMWREVLGSVLGRTNPADARDQYAEAVEIWGRLGRPREEAAARAILESWKAKVGDEEPSPSKSEGESSEGSEAEDAEPAAAPTPAEEVKEEPSALPKSKSKSKSSSGSSASGSGSSSSRSSKSSSSSSSSGKSSRKSSRKSSESGSDSEDEKSDDSGSGSGSDDGSDGGSDSGSGSDD